MLFSDLKVGTKFQFVDDIDIGVYWCWTYIKIKPFYGQLGIIRMVSANEDGRLMFYMGHENSPVEVVE